MIRGIIFQAVLFLSFMGISSAASKIETSRNTARKLVVPEQKDSFSFAILGDLTGTDNFAESLDILKKAAGEINLLSPDFVFTVGDLVPGYTERAPWQQQAKESREALDTLDMPWYPVAGNHDVYWRGENRPAGEHESDYEQAFGPLWYALGYRGCVFISLFSDEGDPATGEKSFEKPSSQVMSPAQTKWLQATLKRAKNARHIFLFLHHPRWRSPSEYGDDWDRIHPILKSAGNVRAVFAGHDHAMHYYGKKDDIEYFTLGTTGGIIPEEERKNGRTHHYFVVHIAADKYSIASVPVGAIANPREDAQKNLLPKTSWFIQSDSERKTAYPVSIENAGAKSCLLRIGVGRVADECRVFNVPGPGQDSY